MKKENKGTQSETQAAALRKRAEEIAQETADQSPANFDKISPAKIKKTLHELRVHQIELEMQNEELQRTQTQLDAQRERYFDLYDLAPIGYVTVSEQGIILEANLTAVTMLGVTRRMLVRQPLTSFIIKEDQNIYYLHRKRLFETGKPQAYELRMMKKDETYFWAMMKMTAAKDADGAPVCRVVLSDITERKLAEEVLRESEEKHKRMIANISDVIAIMDKDGTLKYKSPNIEKWFGWQPDDLVGTDGWETVHPDDLKRIQKEFFTLLDKDNSVATVEYRYKCKDGSYKLIALTAVNLTNDPMISGVLMNYRDITERKQAEEVIRKNEARLAQAQVIAHLGNWEIDLTNQLMLASEEAFRIYGIKYPGAASPFLPLADVQKSVYPEDRPRMDSALKALLQENKRYDHEFRLVRISDGALRVIHSRADVFLSEKGTPLKIFGTIQDITDLKQAEEEKQILEERLIRAEKMESLGLLAGGVAHDLNNVLGIVVGYAEILLDSVDEKSPLRKDLTTIFDGGQRAAAIVDDLLTLARRGVVGKKVLNLNKLIADFKKSPQWSKLLIYHPSVKIQIEMEQDLLNIAASSIHLEKTLYNLVSNASEAMTKGGNININTRNQYIDKPIHGYDTIHEGDYVVLSVSDEGDGISETDLKRIFEPFYTKKIMGRSGTGLGLSVVWGTVKDHQGYIDVQSEEGKGTTFSLYFLITRENIEEESLAVSMSEYLGNGQTLLIVDDVKDQRDLAARLLTSLNYKVSSVSSGEEAIKYLKDNQPDLIVLDMIMDPGMDGLDTYKSVLKINPKQKAIIVSGFSESDRVKEAKVLGAGAYIKKPYIKEKLGLAVKKDLARK